MYIAGGVLLTATRYMGRVGEARQHFYKSSFVCPSLLK